MGEVYVIRSRSCGHNSLVIGEHPDGLLSHDLSWRALVSGLAGDSAAFLQWYRALADPFS